MKIITVIIIMSLAAAGIRLWKIYDAHVKENIAADSEETLEIM